MALTYESVTNDALDLLQKSVAIMRDVIADVAKTENGKPEASEREKAPGRWAIFLGVMLAKVSEGVADLARTDNARPIIVLTRCLFEYEQKAEFFLTHAREAFEQIASIGARRHADLSKLGTDPSVDAQLLTIYQEWERTSGRRDERSGNVRLARMHFENTDPAAVKMDKDGTAYTEEFQTAYGLPSLYVHGEPLLIEEVFPHLEDSESWNFREYYTLVDTLSALSSAVYCVLRFCHVMTKAYDLPSRTGPLGSQYQRIREGMKQVRGHSRI